MNLMRKVARFSALVLGVQLIASCDTRLPTSSLGSASDDVQRPQITFALSTGANNSVDVSSALTVSVTASDNGGIAALFTRISNAAQVIGVDTASYKPTVPSVTRQVPVSLAGLVKGDRITVRSTATDGAQNTATDSVIITVTDTTAPTLKLVSSKAGRSVKTGDTLDVLVSATDSSGLRYVGYQLYRRLSTTDSLLVYAETTFAVVGAAPKTYLDNSARLQQRPLIVDDALLPGSYTINALALDRSGVFARGGLSTLSVTVLDAPGPKVTLLSPIPGDSASRGGNLTIALRGTSTVGLRKLGFKIVSDAGWTTPVNDSSITVYTTGPKDTTMSASVKIPANAPLQGTLTITRVATDLNGLTASLSPISIAIRAGASPAPRVAQDVAARVEASESITVTVTGADLLTYVGFVAKSNLDTMVVVKRDSFPASAVCQGSLCSVPLNFLPAVQGKSVQIRSFAYAGTQVGVAPDAAIALVVYGHTYALPFDRNGPIADLTVDQARGNVFLSNINFGRLEVWQKSAQKFDANGVVVGSQPWGMTLARAGAGAGSMLYVANSGGTNISKVDISAATASGMKEDLAGRLKTRISLLYKLSEVRDVATGRIRITVTGPILFSDRPQFVEQGESGLLYISTKPTASAPAGTVRYVNPSKPAPDERFMLDFATRGNDPNSWLVANVDGAGVTPAPAASSASDMLTLCDHTSGTTNAAQCVSSTGGIQATVLALQAAVAGTDIDARPNLDEGSLGLTDTTFAAASGNGKVITFGQGNTKGVAAKNFLAFDDVSSPDAPISASPAINIADLINNASDEIFGVALDKSGQTIGLHGRESYFAAVDFPFTQRLQGKKSTFNKGAGITFHPNADGITTPSASRLAFVASANGSIEMIDIAYYDFSRGALATKYNLYGPLRASLPFAGDDPSVVFKLFGLSPTGLVVIDVTAADIAAGP
ncbi:MAG: hypothetical protein JWL95_727 [Gemmatimonadetes bacterium]|nr:hypothetical protein [Gemmatimonadota bacterium]